MSAGPTPAAAPPRRLHSRAMRWAVGVGLAAMLSIGLVLMFMLTQATNNRLLY